MDIYIAPFKVLRVLRRQHMNYQYAQTLSQCRYKLTGVKIGESSR